MRGWSFPIGRLFGVDVRIHTFFLLLLGLAISYATVGGASGARGFVLWLILLGAVMLREVVRAVGAAWFNLDVRSVMLLPIGGLVSYASVEATERASSKGIERKMALLGPLANLGFGLVVAALVRALVPEINLFEQPWISPAHLVRSLVWMNLLLGVVNLLPATPLDGGRVFGKAGDGMRGAKAAGEIGQMIAYTLIVGGMALMVSGTLAGMWLLMLGVSLLIWARVEDQGLLLQTDVDAVKMRDVMLREFSTLSASDTLEDALQRSIHSLQDVFPVVRGGNLVGAVSRQGIVEALQTNGNGYVQGLMTRSFQTAQADDSLVKTLRRIAPGRGAQLVPIMEGDRIVGIITPQNLAHSMTLLNQKRRMGQRLSDRDNER